MEWEPRRKRGGEEWEVGVLKGWEMGEVRRNYTKKCFIFRNRKGAKGLKGGGRECKVRKAEGLDPLYPPPEQITIVCFPRFVSSLFVPKDQVYPVV